jgi:hypothetical protein
MRKEITGREQAPAPVFAAVRSIDIPQKKEYTVNVWMCALHSETVECLVLTPILAESFCEIGVALYQKLNRSKFGVLLKNLENTILYS